MSRTSVMDDLRVGIVGLGHVAKHQIGALKITPGVRLAAICDLDAGKKQLAPAGVPFFLELDEFLRQVALDVVVVSVPLVAHVPVACSVLAMDRDLLVEKPVTTDLAAFDKLTALASERGRLLISALHAASGREVLWFRDAYRRGLQAELGPVTSFSCYFYDPYVAADGTLQPGARGLQGAWLDSAINALSVVGQFVEPGRLRIEHAAMTRVVGLEASELQGLAEFSFANESGVPNGRGIINTNWTLGLNAKSTRLYFARSGTEILLDHSAEQVVKVAPTRDRVVLVDLADNIPRLTAHYVGVFDELVLCCRAKQSNATYARELHTLMLQAHRWTRGSAEGRRNTFGRLSARR